MNEWGGKIFYSHGSQNSCGVAVLIRNGFNCTVKKTIIDPSGRFIVLKVDIEDKVYVLVNIYAPNKDKVTCKFFQNLHNTLQSEDLDCEENIICGGDFNCPLNPMLDKRGGVMVPRKMVIDNIECLKTELDLVDVWRIKNPQTKSYTWSQKSPPIFCRLDFWLISNNLQDVVNSTNIIPAIKTDHAAIELALTDSYQSVKGPSFWKMNVSLLEDETYLNDLKNNSPQWKTMGTNDLSVLSNLNSAITLFQHLNLFKNVSGLEVNSSKTEGMWIGSLKSNEEKPFGIKWPSVPIKALGVFFTYDQTLLYEKNFRDKLDKMKKLTNIWSSRGLSIYGKVTIIKSLLIPKLVYASSLLPTPAKIIKQAEHIIYTFLWKGKDKVTRLSAINNFEGGGIKMIDIESMVKALRLAWLKRIFNDNESTWKTYLLYLLKDFGGSLIFECNYTMKDLSIISIFYRELLQWWSEFRDHFSDEKYWLSIIWNHKDIRINGKPVFYKTYYNSGIYTVSDLLLNLDNVESFEAIKNKIEKVNFLTWTGLRHSVPSNLKTLQYEFTKGNASFIYKNDIFDITKVKSKDYHSQLNYQITSRN